MGIWDWIERKLSSPPQAPPLAAGRDMIEWYAVDADGHIGAFHVDIAPAAIPQPALDMLPAWPPIEEYWQEQWVWHSEVEEIKGVPVYWPQPTTPIPEDSRRRLDEVFRRKWAGIYSETAAKGLYAYCGLLITDPRRSFEYFPGRYSHMPVGACYYQIFAPHTPVHISQVPADVSDVIRRVTFPSVRFSQLLKLEVMQSQVCAAAGQAP